MAGSRNLLAEQDFFKGHKPQGQRKKYKCSTILKAGWLSGKESKGKESKGSSVLDLQWKEPRRNSICFAESTKALELATLGPLGMHMHVKLKTRGQLERLKAVVRESWD